MTRPAHLSHSERLALSRAEDLAYEQSWREWWRSPEGQAELARQKARALAAFEAERLALATRMLRDEGAEPGYRIGLPPRAVDAVLAGPQSTVALEAARGAGDILVLLGAPGTGKTVAGVARVREYLFDPANWSTPDAYHQRPYFRRHRPVWITAAELARVDHYKQSEIDRVAKAPLLVVDDLGAEYNDPRGFFSSLLDELVDARYSRKLATVITSNLDASAFAVRYGQRVIDRLREAGRIVGCGNVSLRQRPTTTTSTGGAR